MWLGVTQNKWDAVIPPQKLWEQYERIIKCNGAILLFGQDKFSAMMMLSNPKLHRYNIIWDKVLKSGFLNANKMPLREHEDIMVFYKSPPPYHPQMTVGEKNHSKGKSSGNNVSDIHTNRSYGDYKITDSSDSNLKYPSSIWKFQKPHPSVALHSTEKPVELLRYAIRTFSNPGDLILDNCCGSGSTLIAAKMEGRDYIGIDNGYCDKKKSKYNGMSWRDVSISRLENVLID
ncbi:site-specific DNA-methyltransferase [bacterium D16-76]|nr:site-specific DNA-methyltransferase [bacterium D16-76]